MSARDWVRCPATRVSATAETAYNNLAHTEEVVTPVAVVIPREGLCDHSFAHCLEDLTVQRAILDMLR